MRRVVLRQVVGVGAIVAAAHLFLLYMDASWNYSATVGIEAAAQVHQRYLTLSWAGLATALMLSLVAIWAFGFIKPSTEVKQGEPPRWQGLFWGFIVVWICIAGCTALLIVLGKATGYPLNLFPK